MICQPCQAGRHRHDTWIATGEDAGCPNAVGPDRTECTCPLRMPRRAVRHCRTCTCGAV